MLHQSRNMSTAIMEHSFLTNFLAQNNIVNNPDAAPGAHLGVSSAMRIALSRMRSAPLEDSALAELILNSANQHHRRLERVQSAPGGPSSMISTTSPTNSALNSTTVNTSRYKTELCRPFEEFGVCKYGDKCQFAHGGDELRSLARHPKYKTELCRTYHTTGLCPYGPRCHFVHNQEEVALQKAPLLAARSMSVNGRPRPAALSPSLSLDSPSPPCSLSQSPTSSMGSFFSSEPELHSPRANSCVAFDDQRLPVFNRLSTVELAFSELIM